MNSRSVTLNKIFKKIDESDRWSKLQQESIRTHAASTTLDTRYSPPQPTYDFNYCLMSLFLFCLFGTRFSIFYFTLPPLYLPLQIRCQRCLLLDSVTDMVGESLLARYLKKAQPNRIEWFEWTFALLVWYFENFFYKHL